MTEKSLITLQEASKEIDAITKACIPLSSREMVSFTDTLALAEGIKKLRSIFLTHPGIKDTVVAMQDTRLGFLTDRSPSAIAKAAYNKKTIKPYTYAEIAECCIEGMLKGYRISNNEFNVIAGSFYPAKNGKYRKIIDHPEITNFEFTNTSPVYESNEKYAKVQCYASWLQNGQRASLGFSDPGKKRQDTLIFKVRVNAFMGEDAIVGKALSKLFSRILMRIEGKLLPEATDLDLKEEEDGDVVDAEFKDDKATPADYKATTLDDKEETPPATKPETTEKGEDLTDTQKDKIDKISKMRKSTTMVWAKKIVESSQSWITSFENKPQMEAFLERFEFHAGETFEAWFAKQDKPSPAQVHTGDAPPIEEGTSANGRLQWLADTQIARKEIGDKAYYDILKNYGFESVNEVDENDDSQAEVLSMLNRAVDEKRGKNNTPADAIICPMTGKAKPMYECEEPNGCPQIGNKGKFPDDTCKVYKKAKGENKE